MFALGTIRVASGQRQAGMLEVGHQPDGPILAPVVVVRGRGDGPILWVQACVHGGETGGTAGALRFLHSLDPAALRGTVVAVLAANPTASRQRSRFSWVDGGNLNRLFPGRRDGLHSDQTADALFSAFMQHGDALVDLHSGGETHVVPLYAMHWDDDTPAGQASRRLAEAVGVSDLWRSAEPWIAGSMFAAATKHGKAGILVECGGGGPVAEHEVDSFAEALRQAARHLGMLDAPPAPPPARIHRACTFVNTRRGGLFVPEAAPGDIVPAGARLGHLLGLNGEVVEEYTAPVGPSFLAALPRPYCPLHSGVLVAECVTG